MAASLPAALEYSPTAIDRQSSSCSSITNRSVGLNAPIQRRAQYKRIIFKSEGRVLADVPVRKDLVRELKTRAQKFMWRRCELPFMLHIGPLVQCPCCIKAAKAWKRASAELESKYKSVRASTVSEYTALIRKRYVAPLHRIDDVNKGRTILAGSALRKGELFCEYIGQLISEAEAVRREYAYSTIGCGCFMYFFEHNGTRHCIDSTAERPDYGPGRLISHSRVRPNLKTIKLMIDGVPRLAFICIRDVEQNEELAYDYGEVDPDTLDELDWLEKT